MRTLPYINVYEVLNSGLCDLDNWRLTTMKKYAETSPIICIEFGDISISYSDISITK